MKLKNQFLSLPALLALGMATTAWAEPCNGQTTFDDETRELAEDGQGGYYINMSAPSKTSCHSMRTTVTIPEGVKSFKVYDNGGVNGTFSSFACGGWYCSSNLLIKAPEGYNIRVTGSLTSRVDNVGSDAGDMGYLVFHDKVTGAQLKQYQGTESNILMWIDNNEMNIRFYAADYSGNNQDGLDLTVHFLKKNESKSTAAIDIYDHGDASVYNVAKIGDPQSGTVSVSGVDVDAVVYDRVFTAGTPSTIVLPFQLPAGAETNGKFYRLKKIEQVTGECRWKATMTWIRAKDATALPAANTPYAVIVPSGTELWFKLNGNKTTIQTGTLVNQVDATGKWTFKGTYEYKAWESADDGIGLDYAIAKTAGDGYKAGDFVKVGAGSSSAPMRAYISKDPNMQLQPVGNARPLAMGEVRSIDNLPESIDVEFVDEDEKTTAIGRLNTVTGVIKIDRWFDLKGRSTNHKPTTKGAFFNKKGIAK